MDSKRAIVVGSYVQDHVWNTERIPAPGESRIGTFSTGPGGKGFNQAVALARQLDSPADAHFIGALGPDALADSAKVAAMRFGLCASWIQKTAATAAASVIVDATGANLICVALGANAELSALDITALLSGCEVPSVLVAQLEIALPATRAALVFAKDRGVRSILNPAPINLDVNTALLALADILTPNETEFAFLLGHLHGYEISARDFEDDASLHQAARALSAGTVVITLGAAGAFVSHGEHRMGDSAAFYRVPAEKVIAIDTTGAGDAFTGGLAAASLRFSDAPFTQWVAHAMKVAALSVTRKGAADSMPSYADVLTHFGSLPC